MLGIDFLGCHVFLRRSRRLAPSTVSHNTHYPPGTPISVHPLYIRVHLIVLFITLMPVEWKLPRKLPLKIVQFQRKEAVPGETMDGGLRRSAGNRCLEASYRSDRSLARIEQGEADKMRLTLALYSFLVYTFCTRSYMVLSNIHFCYLICTAFSIRPSFTASSTLHRHTSDLILESPLWFANLYLLLAFTAFLHSLN